jgi:hypothetical protein
MVYLFSTHTCPSWQTMQTRSSAHLCVCVGGGGLANSIAPTHMSHNHNDRRETATIVASRTPLDVLQKTCADCHLLAKYSALERRRRPIENVQRIPLQLGPTCSALIDLCGPTRTNRKTAILVAPNQPLTHFRPAIVAESTKHPLTRIQCLSWARFARSASSVSATRFASRASARVDPTR